MAHILRRPAPLPMSMVVAAPDRTMLLAIVAEDYLMLLPEERERLHDEVTHLSGASGPPRWHVLGADEIALAALAECGEIMKAQADAASDAEEDIWDDEAWEDDVA